MSRHRVCLCCLLSVAGLATVSAGAETRIVGPVPAGQPAASALEHPGLVRKRPVRVDLGKLETARAGDHLRLDLFGDASFVVRLEQASAGVWSGALQGEPHGSFIMVRRGDAAAGSLRSPSAGTFLIRPAAGGGHVAVQLDESRLPGCASLPDAFVPPAGGGIAAGAPSECADGSQVDVLVLYTSVARAAMGSQAAIEAEIALFIAAANIGYANSQIDSQLNLVYVDETAYNENGTYSQHLNRLATPNDGFMDEAHLLRYLYQADLVALIVHDGENCGQAYLMPELSTAGEALGFSVTTWWCDDYVLAHELGHNEGCCHACGDGGGCGCGGLFSYSVGHRYFGNSGNQRRTIMAYPPGQRIPYFSNPDVIFDGQPTGVPVGQPNEADNALTINTTISTIASYRCGLPYCETHKQVASGGAFFDYFGFAADVSGDVAIVGAPFNSDNGVLAGAAYVYRFNPQSETWVQEEQLLPSDGQDEDFFGFAVAISGDVAVVGASGDDDAAFDGGAAYVFRYDQGTSSWIEEDKLLAADADFDDRFGQAVGVSGGAAAVGSWLDDDHGTGSGSIYVFRYNPGTSSWAQEQKLTASDGAASDHLGESVDIDGNALIAGAPSTISAGGAGAAYVYRHNGAAWVQEQKLVASDGIVGDALGESVAISGSVAVAGAITDGDTAIGAGSAFVFRFDGDTWQEEAKLLASNGQPHDNFGIAVAAEGDVVVVGADGSDTLGGGSGAGYVFRHGGATWVEQGQLLAVDGTESDAYGVSVGMGGGSAIVGANLAGDNGAAYTYRGFTGLDCNGNGEADACEILAGSAPDDNGNGVPDECDTPGDIDGDGSVGVTDLLILLGTWGPCGNCGSCPADLDGDCVVSVTDLLSLLGAWG